MTKYGEKWLNWAVQIEEEAGCDVEAGIPLEQRGERSPMKTYTIYDHPSDYPSCYVMRVFETKAGEVIPTDETVVSTNLEAVRAMVPPGCICMPRDPDDDPVILETWL